MRAALAIAEAAENEEGAEYCRQQIREIELKRKMDHAD